MRTDQQIQIPALLFNISNQLVPGTLEDFKQNVVLELENEMGHFGPENVGCGEVVGYVCLYQVSSSVFETPEEASINHTYPSKPSA